MAGAFTVLGQLELWVPFSSSMGTGSAVLTAIVSAATTLPIALRRRAPLAACAAGLLPFPVVLAITDVRVLFYGGLLAMLVLVYSGARYGRDRQGLVAGALGAGVLAFVQARVPSLHQLGEIAFEWMAMIAAWTTGRVIHVRERRADASEERAHELAEQARTALQQERARIARELHDVVAHAISMIVVQAGASEQIVAEDPERARASFRSIRAAGSEALGEMRRLLGVLREDGDELALDPQPGLAGVDALVAQARAVGLSVELHVGGTCQPLSPGLDLTAYRIVQEALTNVRKHAGAQRAQVRVDYRDALEIEVVDDGREMTTVNGSGHGLVGMRERVALYGGTLDAGPRPGGGFRVRAVLPIGEPA
jgi:signal transduction histidine kinase